MLAYEEDEVVGWAAVAPRSELPFARSRKIPHVDDLPVWAVWCIRVRPGHRGRGLSHALLEGAVAYALSQGAPAIEGYPVDNAGQKVDPTMAYLGTPQSLNEQALRRPPTPSPVDFPAWSCAWTCRRFDPEEPLDIAPGT